ncbi:LarC family nickel insertion protein [Rhizobium sp. BK376]|uniref:LarC family nickel insertion protein n=1 Tax=Rhizobium sp. BK376 TaxID=2512149 RepID=UPI0010CFE8BF|nr:LarC family nickel insertion protein [Rhizobium sp. BK376]TCR71023.1 hypothetical protein EV561_13624 [Rhizobium sp. BK376]
MIAALSLCPLIDKVDTAVESHNDSVLTGRRFTVRRSGRRAEERPADAHHHDHTHADWNLIREALVTSTLDRETVRHAIGIFTHLAEAEARVHGVAPDHVRFHEVGAWDSIADIVAAAWLIARINADRWTVGPLPLGSGRIRTAHGLLPVPAPATTLLLEGFATIDDGIAGERVTPTGAAILRHLCDPFETVRAPRRLIASAHGFGTKRLPGISNCVRLVAFETLLPPMPQDQVAVLECEIDDQTGEDMAQAIDNLRSRKGVLDIVQMPVFGKKGRMMVHLRILAEPAARDTILADIFDETTTIGIRHFLSERTILPRQADTIEADGRTLRLKRVEHPSGRTAKLEADDLKDTRTSAARTRLRRLAEDRITEDKE